MPRSTGTYTVSKMLGEPVRAFVPYPLPPAAPALALETFAGRKIGWAAPAPEFLEGVALAAEEAGQNIIDVASLIASDRKHLVQSPKAGPASYRLFETLPMMPRFTIARVRETIKASPSPPSRTARITALHGARRKKRKQSL
jgi:hypothetical protein